MISEETKRYLRNEEWDMGNGQCWECYGLSLEFSQEFFSPRRPEECGHHKDCAFARLLLELGMDVLYKVEIDGKWINRIKP